MFRGIRTSGDFTKFRRDNVLMDEKKILEKYVLTVQKIEGSITYHVSDLYLITKPKETTWEIYGTDIFSELTGKVEQDFFIISISENEKMVLEADSIQTLKDVKEIMEEMKLCGYAFSEESIILYENKENRLISEEKKIDAILGQKEYRRKSIFHRKG